MPANCKIITVSGTALIVQTSS